MSFFDQVRKAIDEFPSRIAPDTVRGHLIGYSDTELGFRQPSLPVGAMVRDEGVLDLYAGATRILGLISGELMAISKSTTFLTRNFSINGLSWFDVTVNGKTLNSKFDKNYKVVATSKKSFSGFYLMNDQTIADPNTGEILNKTPLSDVLTPAELLTDNVLADTPEVGHFNKLKAIIGR